MNACTLCIRFAYSLVDDEDRDDENEIEQGSNKNFGMYMYWYSNDIFVIYNIV